MPALYRSVERPAVGAPATPISENGPSNDGEAV